MTPPDPPPDRRAHTPPDLGERREGYALLLQRVQQFEKALHEIDERHDDGHQRLRQDLRDLDRRTDDALKIQQAHEHRLTVVEQTPPPSPDILKLRFSPPVVVFIVTTFLAVAGGMWTSTYSLRNDVASIITRMAAREQIDLAQATLQTERSATMQKAIDSAERTLKLQQLQIQELTNAVLDLKRGR